MYIPRIYTDAETWHKRGVTGEGVVVAVVDTGVEKHPDIAQIGGWGINGCKPYEDLTGHGTHVAGIIAGAKYGVAPGAKIMPVRICADNTGYSKLEYMQRALKWLIDWRERNAPRLVVNISFSATSADGIRQYINELVGMDVPIVVSAGNDGDERNPIAEYESPIVVGNLRDAETLADSSTCWGELTDCAVIGSNVLSCDNGLGGGYVLKSGTSMSAPAVAGMMALILSRWPEMSEPDAYAYLMSLCGYKAACKSGGHAIPVPVLKDDFEGEVKEDLRQTMYIAGVGEGKALIVRESAETGAEKVGNLTNGDMVTVLGEDGAKSLVATGTCGWIPTSYLTADAPVSTPEKGEDNEPVTGGKDTDYADKPDFVERNEIGQVQELLHKWGFGAMVGEVDGKNGPKTKEAVRQYQAAMGLTVDGIAGPKTLAALKGEVIKPRITEADMRCECAGKYCKGMPNASTAGVRLLIERIRREHEKTRPGVVYHVTNRTTPAPDGAIAGGQRCEKWNKERGGATNSQHRYGRAADIIPKLAGVSDKVLRQECEDIALKLNVSGGVGYGANYIVHVDVRGNRARWKY